MAEEKNPAESAPAPKAKGNKLLIIVVAVLAALLVGGGTAAFFLMRGNHDSETADEAAPADAGKKPAGKGKKEKEAASKGPAIYVALDPPFVVNFEASASVRFLQVSVQLMTRDASTQQLLKDNEPVLRNDLLMLLASQTYETVSTVPGKEALRKQAMDAVKGVIRQEGGKPERLEGVYFTSFVMQ